MSRKNNLLKYPTIVNGDMSTASITSLITNIQFLDNVGVQLNFSGAPVGNFEVQVSADHAQDNEGNVTVAGSWAPIPLAYFLSPSMAVNIDIPTSVGSPIYLDLNQLSAPYIRVVYTRTSGTGTLNAYITCKTI